MDRSIAVGIPDQSRAAKLVTYLGPVASSSLQRHRTATSPRPWLKRKAHTDIRTRYITLSYSNTIKPTTCLMASSLISIPSGRADLSSPTQTPRISLPPVHAHGPLPLLVLSCPCAVCTHGAPPNLSFPHPCLSHLSFAKRHG